MIRRTGNETTTKGNAIMQNLGPIIKDARERAGLSVERLAEKAGLPAAVIERYEREGIGSGKEAPSDPERKKTRNAEPDPADTQRARARMPSVREKA